MTDFSKSQCPDCGSVLAPQPGYRTWCSECDWNVAAEAPPPRDRLTSIYRSLGERLGRELFDQLKSTPPEAMRPRLTREIIAAYVLAGLVHLATVILFAAGLWVIWVDWPNWFLGFVGLALIAAAWGLLPKPMPAPDHSLSRRQAPELYRLADRVADDLGTDRINAIAVDSSINAYFGRFGWRRRSVLGIGAPLWLGLDPGEKVALVAHEMAHQVNRDFARSFWIGGAVRALGDWLDFLRQPYDPDASLGELLGRYLIWALSIPIGALFSALIHLYWRQSQRAEYLADYMGSRLSGSSAYISFVFKMETACSRGDDLLGVVRKFADEPQQIVHAFVKKFEAVPEREHERVRRAAQRELTALDSTHPPTYYRAELVRAFPCAANVELTPDEARQTDAEVLIHADSVGRGLVRSNLHLI